MPTRAALGCKLHTGWAVLVAVAGNPSEIQVLLRRRIELLPRDTSISRFVYHQASEMPAQQASELVKRGRKAAEESARLAVRDAIEEMTSHGVRIDVCGVLCGSTVVPKELAAILGSHPLIHSAEGALFQNAIVSACETQRLRVAIAREREVWGRTAAAWDMKEPELRKKVDLLRKCLGAPWSADHKTSTAIALLALKANTRQESLG
jgi:hypothetical protein